MPLKVFGGSLLLPLRIDGYTFDRLPYTEQVDERFSTQLKDQLPDHIVSNYDAFVQFVEAYYEWMEQKSNPRYEGVRLGTYNDIDQTLDEYVQYFRDTYIKDFPVKLKDGVNEKTIVKYAKDLYLAKGTKASFDLLFRILFDTTVDVSYPRDRLLRLSRSTFDDRQFIRIEPVLSVDESKLIENGLVIQRNPFTKTIKATALIDKVEYKHSGSLDFYALAVQDVSGSFDDATPIEITTSGTTSASYVAEVFPTLNALEINAGGTGYEVNDEVVVDDKNGNRLLTAKVKSVGPVGDIRSLKYTENFGVYRDTDNLQFSFTSFTGAGASFSALAGEVLTDGPDDYLDDTGKLSSRSFIQDNFFYQDFSYILRVNKSLKEFADAVRRLVHPTGSLMFAEFINEVSMTGNSSITSDNITRFKPVIGHYLPHTFGTTLDPRGFTYTTGAGSTHYDFYPRGYNGLDGNTAGEFITTVGSSAGINGASFSPYYLPHVYVTSELEQTHIDAGQSHDPDVFYWKRNNTNTAFVKYGFNILEGVAGNPNTTPDTGNSITAGALGGTAYIGVTLDDDGESAGLGGYFPVGSSRPNVRFFNTQAAKEAGCTHYGGYTSPQETSLSGGFSGGQIIQVVGTDSATADFWVVYRHPAHLGLTALGVTGDRVTVRIPMQPVTTVNTIDNFNFTRDGSDSYQENNPINLVGGSTYSIGEIVTQEKYNEPKAIGRVIEFIPSAFGNQGSPADGIAPTDPMFNIGIDTLVVEVLNGKFTRGLRAGDINGDGLVNATDLSLVLSQFGITGEGVTGDINQDGEVDGADLIEVLANWNQNPRPIVGESSGTSRLVDPSFNSNLNTSSVTYDTSWLDIPINIMVNDIDYSNVTN